MLRGNLRRIIASGMLAVCLLLAFPDSVQARKMELPSHEDQAEYGIDSGNNFWQKLWIRIESIWNKSSVLIIPEG